MGKPKTSAKNVSANVPPIGTPETESAKAKANLLAFEKLLESEIFAECASDLSNRLTGQKHSIYRKSIFDGCDTTRAKIKLRGQLRAKLQNFVSTFFVNKENTKDVAEKFVAYYKKTYLVNDFSVESVSSSEETRKDKALVNFMKFVKVYHESTESK